MDRHDWTRIVISLIWITICLMGVSINPDFQIQLIILAVIGATLLICHREITQILNKRTK